MNNEVFKKNISLGLSLDLSIDDYINIFEKYGDNIRELYFSVPLGDILQTRLKIVMQYKNKNNIEKLKKILSLTEKYNIKNELAINSILNLDKNYVKKIFDWCNDNNIKVDKIVTFNNLIEECIKYFGKNIEYCYSYNNNLTNINQLYKINENFSEIVVGNRNLRDLKLFKEILKQNKKIKLLVNNGCSHNCYWCSTGNNRKDNKITSCEAVVKRNFEKFTPEYICALQSIYPYELYEIYNKLDIIDSYKLCSRASNIEQFYSMLDLYINNKSINNLFDFSLTNCLGYVYDQIENKKIDYNLIMKYKQYIWKECFKNANINY